MPSAAPLDGHELSLLSSVVEGQLFGDGTTKVLGICSFDEPHPNCLAFAREKRAERLLHLLKPRILAALVLPSGLEEPEYQRISASLELPILAVKGDPLAAIVKLIPYFYKPYSLTSGTSEKADIHPTVQLGENVSVGPFVAIGESVRIGANTVIYPHVTIYPGAQIGSNVVIHSGAVIREECIVGDGCIILNGAVVGAEGFGYMPDPEVGLKSVPQIGKVVLEGRVEVGANTCIDRAAFGKTTIGQGTKIDNLVQVGHNCKIGSHSIVCGQVGIAGSATIGNNVTLGGGVGVRDHVKIGDGVRIAARSGVTCNLTDKGDYSGFPAMPISEWRKQVASIRLIPKLLRRFRITGNEN